MASSDPEAYRGRVVERLRALVDSHGYSVAEVEQQLAHSRGYLADALRGVKKLTVETILEVLGALDVPPEEFFERPMPPPRRRLRRRGRKPRRSVISEVIFPSSLESSAPVVRSMLRLLASKGLLGAEDLEELQHELSAEPPEEE